MKKKILLYIIFTNFSLFAQNDSLQVEYTLFYSNEEITESKSELDKSVASLSENKINLNFRLNATKNNSYFVFFENKHEIDNSKKMALALSGYSAPIYFDINKRLTLEDHDDRILGKYVLKKEPEFHNWIITKQTKKIGSFVCFMAYTDEIINNINGKFNNRITVWFTTEIPYSIGPLGITGLPGLVLELNNRNVVFGAKTIRFNNFKDFVIIKPDDKNAITKNKVSELRKEFLNGKD